MPFNIAVLEGDINDLQGMCTFATSSPAGNTFTHNCNNPFDDLFLETQADLTYSHHIGVPYTPDCKSTTVINEPCMIGFNDGSCPDKTILDDCDDPEFPPCRTAEIESMNNDIATAEAQLAQETPGTAEYKQLENEIQYLKDQRGLLYNNLIREGIRRQKVSDVTSVLDTINDPFVEQKLIAWYIGLGDYSAATQKLNGFTPINQADSLFVDYYTTLMGIHSSGRTYLDITAAEEAVVREVAAADIPLARKAQNILEFVFEEDFPEVFLPLPSYSEKRVYPAPLAVALKAYPNPVSDRVFFEVENIQNASKIVLSLSDINGRQVKQEIVGQGNQRIGINISDLVEGVYIATLHHHEGLLARQKVVIIR